jgi:hypothetical protein
MTTTTECATATALPSGKAGWAAGPATVPALPRRPTVVVTVIGHAGSLSALADQLPAHWTVRSAAADEHVDTDLLVIAGATGSRIRAALVGHRGVPVIGIVDAFASAEQVVEVLEAGADACVRSGQAALVGSHLRACHRRRTLAA